MGFAVKRQATHGLPWGKSSGREAAGDLKPFEAKSHPHSPLARRRAAFGANIFEPKSVSQNDAGRWRLWLALVLVAFGGEPRVFVHERCSTPPGVGHATHVLCLQTAGEGP